MTAVTPDKARTVKALCESGTITAFEPAFAQNNVPVVMSADSNYAPYLAVCIRSLVDNSSAAHNYDIIILTQDIAAADQDKIRAMQRDNVTIRFYDMNPLLEQSGTQIFALNSFYSVATYFRLFLPEIMRHYDKILYLDCDMVILRDVAELFACDVGENYLGATRDISIINTRHMPLSVFNDPKNHAFYTREMDVYLREVIGLENPDDYFQAGVLLWNIRKMRQDNMMEKFFEALLRIGKPRYVDQCVLNAACAGKVTYLPRQWNLMLDILIYYANVYRQAMPEKYQDEFHKTVADPFIVHMTGGIKSWHDPAQPLGYYFWRYARRTPYYEQILYKNILHNCMVQASYLHKGMNNKPSAYRLAKYRLLSRYTWGQRKWKYKKKYKDLKARLAAV